MSCSEKGSVKDKWIIDKHQLSKLLKEKAKEKEKHGRWLQIEEEAYSSKKLAENLIAAGVHRPPGTAAHHIVAGNHPAASRSREILQSLGIGINDAVNGVFLPHKERDDEIGTYHREIHTKRYFFEVEKRLEWAANHSYTKEETIEILEEVRQHLIDGVFPY